MPGTAQKPLGPKSDAESPAEGILARLGPGLITGAADDDPSGIATYSQVGAQFGFGMLWTMLFSFPLMAAMQEICARLGRITGKGIAANFRKHYPRPLTYTLVLLLCCANIFNIGADVTAMGASAQLVFRGPANLYVLIFGAISLFLQVRVPYSKYVRYLKWLTLVLFTYVATAFAVHVPWREVLRGTVMPSFQWTSEYWMGLVAVLGTTISPYLFFWQTSEEAEEIRVNAAEKPLKKKPSAALRHFRRIALDTRVGMAMSNIVAFFIILTAAVTLHQAGGATINTAADAAKALRPLAGNFAFLLFALGIVGTGLLAVPVLAGSAAYAVAETFRWRASLQSTAREAPKFYFVLAVATVIGIALNFLGMNPIRALFLSAVVNGIVSAPLTAMLMIASANPKVVGKFKLPAYLRVAGWVTTAVITIISVIFIAQSVR